MADWWLEELKQRAQRRRAIETHLGDLMEVDPETVLMLISMATQAPPPDALAQCQQREENLQEELDDERRTTFDLQYENNHLRDRIDELEEEVRKLTAQKTLLEINNRA